MRVRKILAAVCYILSISAYLGAGYVSLLAYKGSISYNLGFLIFLPLWIVTYWFTTFFSQLIEIKTPKGKKKYIIKKIPRKILNGITTLLSSLLLIFWVFTLVTQVASGNITITF